MKTPDGEILTAHTVYGPSLAEVLDDIEAFVNAHPMEVLFLHFREDYGVEQIKGKLNPPPTTLFDVQTVLDTRFGSRIFTGELNNDVTIGEFQSAGKSIVWAWDNLFTLQNSTTKTQTYSDTKDADPKKVK